MSLLQLNSTVDVFDIDNKYFCIKELFIGNCSKKNFSLFIYNSKLKYYYFNKILQLIFLVLAMNNFI